MPLRLDLVGKKFGKLTVISFDHTNRNLQSYWKCKCDCGKEILVRGSHLNTKNTKSCGCLRNQKTHERCFKDLTNKKFFRLTVIKFDHIGEKNRSYWKCRCDCGEEKIIRGTKLTNGSTLSCGCYCKEIHSKENSHFWKGGISFEPYCLKFNDDLKRRVRYFYNYECLICGKSQKENNKALSVHHVEYDKMSCCNDKPVQFAALCTSCHAKTGHNRKQWEAMIHIIIDYLYDGKSYYTKEEYKNLK